MTLAVTASHCRNGHVSNRNAYGKCFACKRGQDARRRLSPKRLASRADYARTPAAQERYHRKNASLSQALGKLRYEIKRKRAMITRLEEMLHAST